MLLKSEPEFYSNFMHTLSHKFLLHPPKIAKSKIRIRPKTQLEGEKIIYLCLYYLAIKFIVLLSASYAKTNTLVQVECATCLYVNKWPDHALGHCNVIAHKAPVR